MYTNKPTKNDQNSISSALNTAATVIDKIINPKPSAPLPPARFSAHTPLFHNNKNNGYGTTEINTKAEQRSNPVTYIK